jgi:hypothetical protein
MDLADFLNPCDELEELDVAQEEFSVISTNYHRRKGHQDSYQLRFSKQ